MAGIEPAPYSDKILSLARLPIPPHELYWLFRGVEPLGKEGNEPPPIPIEQHK